MSTYENYGTNKVLSTYQPQVIDKDIITSNQWIKVCQIFKATTPAVAINIGNFSDDESTQAIVVAKAPFDSYFYNAYYFIDDVSVEKVSNPDSLAITLSGNTSICLNQSTPLEVLPHFDNVTWTMLSDTTDAISSDSIFQAMPQASTTYHVKAEFCHYTVSDTITVHVNSVPKINLGNDPVRGNLESLNCRQRIFKLFVARQFHFK